MIKVGDKVKILDHAFCERRLRGQTLEVVKMYYSGGVYVSSDDAYAQFFTEDEIKLVSVLNCDLSAPHNTELCYLDAAQMRVAPHGIHVPADLDYKEDRSSYGDEISHEDCTVCNNEPTAFTAPIEDDMDFIPSCGNVWEDMGLEGSETFQKEFDKAFSAGRRKGVEDAKKAFKILFPETIF